MLSEGNSDCSLAGCRVKLRLQTPARVPGTLPGPGLPCLPGHDDQADEHVYPTCCTF